MQTSLDFLAQLALNNNRDWFTENKKNYETAKSEFLGFVSEIIQGLAEFEPELADENPKKTMFRINRDIRFSKDKSPYKTNFGAAIAKGGRKSGYPAYYIHFQPGNSFIGGGVYQPEPKLLKAIRSEIYENTSEFKSIINEKKFKQFFDGLHGDKLKSAPRGFDKLFEDIELLKNKHYAVMHSVSDEFWLKNNVFENTMEIFHSMKPFNNYLNKVCAEFKEKE